MITLPYILYICRSGICELLISFRQVCTLSYDSQRIEDQTNNPLLNHAEY
jgi:hypothetical protein